MEYILTLLLKNGHHYHYTIKCYDEKVASFEKLAENKYIFDLKRNTKGNFTFKLENISNNVFTKRNSPYTVELIINCKKEETAVTKQQQQSPQYINLKPFDIATTPVSATIIELEIKIPCPSRTLFLKHLMLYMKNTLLFTLLKKVQLNMVKKKDIGKSQIIRK